MVRTAATVGSGDAVALKLVTAPAELPVSLDEAKAHLRVDGNDEDDLIDILIRAATSHAERLMGRAIVEQTWDFYLDEFPSDGWINIPKPPLISVTGFFYTSGDTETAVDASVYRIDSASEPARISLAENASWPTPAVVSNAVRIRFTAGYIDDSSPPSLTTAIPFDIIAAIKLMIGTLYANRETVVLGQAVNQLPWAAEQLLRQHRVHTAMA